MTAGESPFQQLQPYRQQNIPGRVFTPNLELFSKPSISIQFVSPLIFHNIQLIANQANSFTDGSRAFETPFPTASLTIVLRPSVLYQLRHHCIQL